MAKSLDWQRCEEIAARTPSNKNTNSYCLLASVSLSPGAEPCPPDGPAVCPAQYLSAVIMRCLRHGSRVTFCVPFDPSIRKRIVSNASTVCVLLANGINYHVQRAKVSENIKRYQTATSESGYHIILPFENLLVKKKKKKKTTKLLNDLNPYEWWCTVTVDWYKKMSHSCGKIYVWKRKSSY